MLFKPDYFYIPREVYENSVTTWLDCMVYAVVHWMERLRYGKCTASNETIGEVLGVAAGSVANALTRLEKQGLIKRGFKDAGKRSRLGIRTTVKISRVSSMDETLIHQPVNRESNNIKKKNTRDSSNRAPFSLKEIPNTGRNTLIKDIAKIKKSRQPRHKNPDAVRIQQTFRDQCVKNLGVAPILDAKGYHAALNAMKKGELTVGQVEDMLDDWFYLDQSEEVMISLTAALSYRNIEKYKVRNQIFSR